MIKQAVELGYTGQTYFSELAEEHLGFVISMSLHNVIPETETSAEEIITSLYKYDSYLEAGGTIEFVVDEIDEIKLPAVADRNTVENVRSSITLALAQLGDKDSQRKLAKRIEAHYPDSQEAAYWRRRAKI